MLFQSNLSVRKVEFTQKISPEIFLRFQPVPTVSLNQLFLQIVTLTQYSTEYQYAMTVPFDEYLTSDELRLLTHRGSSEMQIHALLRMGVKFELDRYSCPLVRYDDAKPYFLMQAKPLPRGLSDGA